MAYKKISVLKKYVKFQNSGDFVEGYLYKLIKDKIYDREVERGILLTENNEELYLPSNYQISEFFKKAFESNLKFCKVKIVYLGNEKTRLGRAVKNFEFYIDEEDRLSL